MLTLNIIKSPTISLHIIDEPRTNCNVNSKRSSKYTVSMVKEKGTEVHNGKFSYELVRGDHVQKWNSRIPIVCNDCRYGSDGTWTPRINDHLRGRGCPRCSGCLKWTFERFSQEVIAIRNMYDYSLVRPEHINSKNSQIPVICIKCKYGDKGEWTPTIHDHVNGNRGCPSCAKRLPYTYDLFIKRASIVHGDSFDYGLITPGHINGWNSYIPIICNACKFGSDGTWIVSLSSHIRGHGCPKCFGNDRWTLERFIDRASLVHNNRYDYSLVTRGHINGCDSKVPIICNICCKVSNPRIADHVNKKRGCTYCRSSKGEIAISDYLDGKEISFIPQYSIPSLSNRYYDFMINWNNMKVLIEFDGLQHFQYIKLFHKESMEIFFEKQNIDKVKTIHALANDYRIIRIDYNEIDNIEYHIVKALQSFDTGSTIYLSNVEMYRYLGLTM